MNSRNRSYISWMMAIMLVFGPIHWSFAAGDTSMQGLMDMNHCIDHDKPRSLSAGSVDEPRCEMNMQQQCDCSFCLSHTNFPAFQAVGQFQWLHSSIDGVELQPADEAAHSHIPDLLIRPPRS